MSKSEDTIHGLKELAANPEELRGYRQIARDAALELETTAGRLQAAQAVIAKVSALHVRGETSYDPGEGMVTTEDDRIPDGCQHCQVPWPCQHAVILTGADTPAQKAALAAQIDRTDLGEAHHREEAFDE